MWRHRVLSACGLALVVGIVVASASCGHGRPSGQSTPSPAPSASVPGAPTPTVSPNGSPSATVTRTPTRPPTTPPGQPSVPASLRGTDVEVIPTDRRVVALTFDAGANADGLAAILATLYAEHVTGTFFLTGSFAKNFPASVAAIVARGHRLGNHTATHPHIPSLSTDAAVVQELRLCESQLKAAGGTDPRPLFRFPFGDRTSHTIAVVNGAGYVAVRWTVDTLGWKGTGGGITVDRVVDRVVGGARPGEIVLMHVGSNPDDGTTLDAQALPTTIARLRNLGYGFVTLDALLVAT